MAELVLGLVSFISLFRSFVVPNQSNWNVRPRYSCIQFGILLRCFLLSSFAAFALLLLTKRHALRIPVLLDFRSQFPNGQKRVKFRTNR